MNATSITETALPLSSTRAQIVTAGALAALMICTRGQHFASIDALPSASWAVFFLAGALLRPMWALPAFFVLSSLLDVASLASGTITDWCLSPAYWALALAYASLWLGGHAYRGLHRDAWRAVPRLALALIATATVAYVLSKGGFWFFSGRYAEPTLGGFVARIPHYYPRALGTLAGYVGIVFALRALWIGVSMRIATRRGAHA